MGNPVQPAWRRDCVLCCPVSVTGKHCPTPLVGWSEAQRHTHTTGSSGVEGHTDARVTRTCQQEDPPVQSRPASSYPIPPSRLALHPPTHSVSTCTQGGLGPRYKAHAGEACGDQHESAGRKTERRFRRYARHGARTCDSGLPPSPNPSNPPPGKPWPPPPSPNMS